MNDSKQPHWLVVTDLDGTLLDHYTYSFSAAKSALDNLERHNIPVILNSSKTAREIEKLRTTLNNKHPFIVENGSGIILPRDYFSQRPAEAEDWKNYWEITLGKPRDQLIREIQQLPEKFQPYFRAFHTLTAAEISDITGLSHDEAVLSNDRLFTEPLQWIGDEKQRQDFYHTLHKKHIHFTEGGRFIHLMGHTNKGSAINWLSRYYEQEYEKSVRVVALGDGNNDIDMLKAADVAVVIRSPAHQPPEFDHKCKLVSHHLGPEGWAETINTIFFSHLE